MTQETPAEDWHHLPGEEAIRRLASDRDTGLSAEEAARRLQLYGPNQMPQPHPKSAFARLLAQFLAPLVLVLIAAGAVTALLGEWLDSAVIFGVVLINAVVGFIQEGKAEEALAALARALATEAEVVRDRQRLRLDARLLVPGDIVRLAAGDRVPADVRLIFAHRLRSTEAALTGESLPIDKHAAALPPATRLADRRNMAFAGTHIVGGQGLGLVIATGEATATGRIAQRIAELPELKTPLTRKIDAFSRRLLWAILALAGLTVAIGLARGEPLVDMLMAAVALAIGAIPEGLPAAMTIMLAIGIGRMARRRATARMRRPLLAMACAAAWMAASGRGARRPSQVS